MASLSFVLASAKPSVVAMERTPAVEIVVLPFVDSIPISTKPEAASVCERANSASPAKRRTASPRRVPREDTVRPLDQRRRQTGELRCLWRHAGGKNAEADAMRRRGSEARSETREPARNRQGPTSGAAMVSCSCRPKAQTPESPQFPAVSVAFQRVRTKRCNSFRRKILILTIPFAADPDPTLGGITTYSYVMLFTASDGVINRFLPILPPTDIHSSKLSIYLSSRRRRPTHSRAHTLA